MSNFIVSARKYRPSRFEDVVGQEHISQTLKNALRSDHVAHAFLFTGPRGVGKTTCARILAKVLNCQSRTPDFEACNTCDSCKAFNENASFNITELDAASNNSVEHIRSLIEQVRFAPQQGKYKIFIIDEVHMLSQQAFNAFLKTLEEPPPYAIFILATTEKHKIIPTILSRCQIYDFRRIQPKDAMDYLQGICVKEDIKADEDALFTIGTKADGAMRDALSIFDRIVSAAGKHITYKDVIDNLNILDYEYYFKVVEALMTEDVSKILLLFDDILKKGFDPEIFINGLSEHLRNLLVARDVQTLTLLEVSEVQKELYRKQSQISTPTMLLTALNLCNDCDIQYKQARNKRLHVEMSLIKMTYIHKAVSIAHYGPNVDEKKNTSTQPPLAKVAEPDVSSEIYKPNEAKKLENTGGSMAKNTLENEIEKGVVVSEIKIKTAPKIAAMISPSVGNLADLYASLQNDDNAVIEKKEGAMPFNEANLLERWSNFAETVTSPTTKATLMKAEVRLKDQHCVTVIVASTVSENLIRQEVNLLNFLREQFQINDLKLDIQIDKEKIAANTPPPPPKPFSAREKFELMVSENPVIQELRNAFDLGINE